jgi:hypothetical protein
MVDLICVWYCNSFCSCSLKNRFKKNIFSYGFKKIGFKKICLVEIVVRWIFVCKINKKQVFLNEKHTILAFTKLRFKTQLYVSIVQKPETIWLTKQFFLYSWVKTRNYHNTKQSLNLDKHKSQLKDTLVSHLLFLN